MSKKYNEYDETMYIEDISIVQYFDLKIIKQGNIERKIKFYERKLEECEIKRHEFIMYECGSECEWATKYFKDSLFVLTQQKFNPGIYSTYHLEYEEYDENYDKEEMWNERSNWIMYISSVKSHNGSHTNVNKIVENSDLQRYISEYL